jgi:SseB protein N-terminal domain
VAERSASGTGDAGGADPAVSAALAAYAAGEGSEHAVLTALARSRLLVPVVAVLAEASADVAAAGGGREKISEMALPTLVGSDGRPAVLAFTCLDSLIRWRPDARPIPVPAGQVWRAGAQEASAVVVDVAGPVPLAVDGARLAALAGGAAVPPPHEDPDVAAAAEAALAGETMITGAELAGPATGGDIMLQVTLAPGCDPALAGAAVRRAVATLMAGAGGRLRRGVEVAVIEAARPVGQS